MPNNNLTVDRQALSRVFTEPRTLRAFEQIQKQVLGNEGGVTIDSSTVFVLTGPGAIIDAVDDADAALKGVTVGGVYRNSSVIQVRVD